LARSAKSQTRSTCDFIRIRDGKIAEPWSVQDTISLLRGIGALNPQQRVAIDCFLANGAH
jgi:predicted SnoaL-like aldol condensation-catalyzing enzyme